MAVIGGVHHTAPETIGQSDAAGAMNWYRKLARKFGVPAKDETPGTPIGGGLRRTTITFPEEVAVMLGELLPRIAAEHLLPRTGVSHAFAVLVREGYSARFPGKAKKG